MERTSIPPSNNPRCSDRGSIVRPLKQSPMQPPFKPCPMQNNPQCSNPSSNPKRSEQGSNVGFRERKSGAERHRTNTHARTHAGFRARPSTPWTLVAEQDLAQFLPNKALGTVDPCLPNKHARMKCGLVRLDCFPPPPYHSVTQTHTQARTHAHAQTQARAHTLYHTHARTGSLSHTHRGTHTTHTGSQTRARAGIARKHTPSHTRTQARYGVSRAFVATDSPALLDDLKRLELQRQGSASNSSTRPIRSQLLTTPPTPAGLCLLRSDPCAFPGLIPGLSHAHYPV